MRVRKFMTWIVVAQIAALAAIPGRSLAQVSLPSGPPYTTVSATGNSGSVAVGDMNGDGNNDVIIGRYENQNVQVVPGDGQGGFGIPAEFPAFPSSLAARPRGIVIGDINVDGNLDVVTFDYATTGAFSVLFGDGAGNLGNPTVYNVYDTRNPGDTRYVVWSAAIGDVNGDGKPDLIVGGANNFFTSKGDVWVLLNGGSGNFAPPTIVWTRFMGHGDVPAQFVTVGDLDGDGNGDIVVTSGFGQFGSGNVVTVLYGNGTGTFPSTVGMPFPLTPNGRANQAQGVVIADMDGIGLRDLVVSASDIGGTRTGGVTLFRSTGARTFDGGTTYPTLFFRNGMGAVGDLNGDSNPDVVVTGATTGDSFAYFLNNGSGGLGAPVYVPGLRAYGLALGDLTSSGPGTLDVVVGTTGAGTQMLQNGPAGQPNQPPDVSGAAPSVASLWPPNNKMVDISILGVTDPDGDDVTIQITGITNNETGSADASGVGTATAQVRAARNGKGSGRTYTISFTAFDGQGGESQGTVNVVVPHDQGKNTSANSASLSSENKVVMDLSPTEYVLANAYPNPFNPSTTISYELPEPTRVQLSVFDMLGREVAVLVDGEKSAGRHAVRFNAEGLTSGIYVYRIHAGTFTQTRKFTLMK
ncbi:MAG: VCBS repeat-containing protein [Ignavibacteriales bacterium]|nr:VCBS repeat-containing protein [Ignavibacteriales bacterium]